MEQVQTRVTDQDEGPVSALSLILGLLVPSGRSFVSSGINFHNDKIKSSRNITHFHVFIMFMCVIYVCTCMHVGVHAPVRSEFDIKHLPLLPATVSFETGSLTEPRTH